MNASYLLQVIEFCNILYKQQTLSWPSTFSLSLDIFSFIYASEQSIS